MTEGRPRKPWSDCQGAYEEEFGTLPRGYRVQENGEGKSKGTPAYPGLPANNSVKTVCVAYTSSFETKCFGEKFNMNGHFIHH